MRPVIKYSMLVLLGTFISAVSQVLLKKSAVKTYENRISEYINPFVITAYALFFSATLLSVAAYRVIPLSLGTVLESTSYLYVTLFGKWFFSEKITVKKILSLAMIIGGIIIFSIG